MPSLRELQTGVREALLADDAGSVAAEILPDRLGGPARLGVYRHHVRASLTAALESTFPVVCRLVDRRFFGWLADCYIRSSPPTRPCLFEYGGDFAEFIAAFPACAGLPWLPDVARLEWAMNRALHAPDATPLEPHRLDGVRPVRLHPSVTLLASAWPIDAIWRANQGDADPDARLDLDAGGVRLQVHRGGDDVMLRALPPGTFALRAALAPGASLHAAVEAARAAGASLDVVAEIRALVDEEILVAW